VSQAIKDASDHQLGIYTGLALGDVIGIKGTDVHAVKEVDVEPNVRLFGDEFANGESKHLRLCSKVTTKQDPPQLIDQHFDGQSIAAIYVGEKSCRDMDERSEMSFSRGDNGLI
jgi:hypothetical protein